MKSSATVTWIPELKGGPFLFTDGLEESCRKAAQAGFDAVELIIASADAVDPMQLHDTLAGYNLKLAAVSSGGGYLVHKLHLGDPDAGRRRQALEYISHIVDLAGSFGAVVIIGVMKGYIGQGVDRARAETYLREALEVLGTQAEQYDTCLVLETLNRYESNFINRLQEGVELIKSLDTAGVKMLADLFHMNIEEQSIGEALRKAGRHVGHVHFADSNRRAAGCGHTDFAEVGKALKDIGYDRYVSAEIFPYPDENAAARMTLEAFRNYCL